MKIILCMFAVLLFVPSIWAQRPAQDAAIDLNAQIAAVIEKVSRIKPGMTRADLLTVFTTEGGISTRLWQTYVYQKCPYIKVDVEFEPRGSLARDRQGRLVKTEDPNDRIKSISKPYLEFSIMD